MQREEDSKVAKGILSAWLRARAEKRRREFEEHKDAVRMAHEEQLEERRISARMEEARETRQFQEKLAADEAHNQLKIALFNAEMQWKLSQINIRNQKELALFNAEVQRELARFNAENQMNMMINTAELNYNLESYPLYVRSWVSKKMLYKADYLPVKVVVIPPDEDGGKWEQFLTSRITYFLQSNVPDTFYDFLGGAWRSGRCTGQTAYNLIYEEFHEEPFLIVDCDFMNESRLGIRICFWYPGSSGIQVRQFIHDWDVRTVLNSSSDNKELLQGSADAHEYMHLCAVLCEWVIGAVVDIFQMSVGTSQSSIMLKILPKMAKEFSGRIPEDIFLDLIQGMLAEYGLLVQDEFSLAPRARIHCTCDLANALYELRNMKLIKVPGYHRKVEAYVKSAWNQWCGLMGIEAAEVGSILMSDSDTRALCSILREDSDSCRDLKEIYELYGRFNSRNDKLVCLFQKIYTLEGEMK